MQEETRTGAVGETASQEAQKPKQPRKGTVVSLYLPDKRGGKELLEQLKAHAEKEDRSLNWVVIQALQEYFDRHQ